MAKEKRFDVKLLVGRTKAQKNEQRRRMRRELEDKDFDHEIREVYDKWPTVKVDVIPFK